MSQDVEVNFAKWLVLGSIVVLGIVGGAMHVTGVMP